MHSYINLIISNYQLTTIKKFMNLCPVGLMISALMNELVAHHIHEESGGHVEPQKQD